MIKETIQFRVGTKHGKKKNVRYNFIHNCPEPIEKYFDEWCEDNDPEDMMLFVEHIKSKGYEIRPTMD